MPWIRPCFRILLAGARVEVSLRFSPEVCHLAARFPDSGLATDDQGLENRSSGLSAAGAGHGDGSHTLVACKTSR
jgi:hypothetical protein